MRELHGVVFGDRLYSQQQLKHHLMLFDKLQVVSMGTVIRGYEDEFTRDLDFLYSQGLLVNVLAPSASDVAFHPSEIPISPSLRPLVVGDIMVRHVVSTLVDPDHDVAGVYEFSHTHRPPPGVESAKSSIETAVSVGLSMLPIPDYTCALEDIFNFKTDMRDKQWAFRRFLKTLATKHQTVSEIRDDIEWTINEYSRAMTLHNLKSSVTFVEVVVLALADVIQSLVTHDWEKVARGALSIKKRDIELLEAEMKAPGRECAYVFEARKQFGAK